MEGIWGPGEEGGNMTGKGTDGQHAYKAGGGKPYSLGQWEGHGLG